MRAAAVRAVEELGWDGEVVYATTFAQRLAGLLLRGRLRAQGSREILVFPHCSSVHTCWMPSPIDVAFADASGKVIAVHSGVAPWSARSCPQASFTLERMMG